MSAELNGINPSFTIRRNMQHALDDSVLVDELRKVVVLLILNQFVMHDFDFDLKSFFLMILLSAVQCH